MACTLELLPYSKLAEPYEINQYQQKIGSLLYTTVNTQPDIVFAILFLAYFLTNLGPMYQSAAD
jgi:hypothetical protein